MNNANNMNIKVWGILIRTFHWSLVVSFFIAYVSEEESLWHIYSGYTVFTLIIFRVLWGIMGSKYARFSNFLYSPAHTLNYLKTFIAKKPKRYLGHNPAGALMVVALLISLFVVTISGLKLYAIEEGKGPLAGNNISIISAAYADDEYEGDKHKEEDEYKDSEYKKEDKHKNNKHKEDEFWEEIHETSTNFTLFLILLHVLGVVVSGKLHNENLIKSMLTGNKKS